MSDKQRVALVTGASSGNGKAIAEDLARQGYFVFAAARSEGKLEAIRSEHIEPLPLDVTDGDAVRNAVERIAASKGRLDILINNAGYGLYGTIEGATQEQVRHVFDVNVFGYGRVIQAVLPLMRAQKSGLIINMSSVVGKLSIPVLGWYAATKHAIEGMTDALRLEVKQFGINVVLVEPSYLKTGFEAAAMAELDASNDPEAYGKLLAAYRRGFRKGYANAPGAEVVVAAVNKAIAARRPKARYRPSRESRMLITLRSLLSDRLFDALVEKLFK
jgi:NAD(P)-dependent dehydrogenase (short-subunit alcohol dehydrogenase family)